MIPDRVPNRVADRLVDRVSRLAWIADRVVLDRAPEVSDESL